MCTFKVDNFHFANTKIQNDNQTSWFDSVEKPVCISLQQPAVTCFAPPKRGITNAYEGTNVIRGYLSVCPGQSICNLHVNNISIYVYHFNPQTCYSRLQTRNSSLQYSEIAFNSHSTGYDYLQKEFLHFVYILIQHLHKTN